MDLAKLSFCVFHRCFFPLNPIFLCFALSSSTWITLKCWFLFCSLLWPSCHASAVTVPMNVKKAAFQVLLCKAMVCIAELMAFKMSKGNVAHRKKKKKKRLLLSLCGFSSKIGFCALCTQMAAILTAQDSLTLSKSSRQQCKFGWTHIKSPNVHTALWTRTRLAFKRCSSICEDVFLQCSSLFILVFVLFLKMAPMCERWISKR